MKPIEELLKELSAKWKGEAKASAETSADINRRLQAGETVTLQSFGSSLKHSSEVCADELDALLSQAKGATMKPIEELLREFEHKYCSCDAMNGYTCDIHADFKKLYAILSAQPTPADAVAAERERCAKIESLRQAYRMRAAFHGYEEKRRLWDYSNWMDDEVSRLEKKCPDVAAAIRATPASEPQPEPPSTPSESLIESAWQDGYEEGKLRHFEAGFQAGLKKATAPATPSGEDVEK